MSEVEKTPEQLAAEQQAAADKQAAKEAAKAQKDAEKAAEKERKAAEKEAAKQAKAAELEAKKAEKAASRVEQNGISRPLTGATKQVWDIADRISAEKQAPAERKEVTAAGLAEGLQQGTIHTQYGRWRKYHGLVAVREVKVKAAPAVPSAPTEAGE